MSTPKIAFCFPGQGSLEAGMGREIALAVPAAMEVYERGERGLGPRSASASASRLRRRSSCRPRCSSRRSSPRAWPCWPRCASTGSSRTVVVGHSVGEFAALAAAQALLDVDDAIRLVRERGLAMAEAARENPGSMAAILGLDDEVVEALCARIASVWPANYNCPGQIVDLRARTRPSTSAAARREREGARRTVKLRVSGAFHSPLVARAAEHLRPALERAKFSDPIAPFMSTVTAKIEPAQRMAALLVEQLTAPVRFTQAARELMRQGVKVFVEVGPGQRPHRFTEEDRPQREGDPGRRPRLAREARETLDSA